MSNLLLASNLVVYATYGFLLLPVILLRLIIKSGSDQTHTNLSRLVLSLVMLFQFS